MLPQIIFLTHLVLGYVACLLCFGVYVLPRLRSMERMEAHRVIATVHSFRFFGLVFILPGVVGLNLQAPSLRLLLTATLQPEYWPYWRFSR
jgi:hypothetical protein